MKTQRNHVLRASSSTWIDYAQYQRGPDCCPTGPDLAKVVVNLREQVASSYPDCAWEKLKADEVKKNLGRESGKMWFKPSGFFC